MKTRSVSEVARNFRAILDVVEDQQEEIVLLRNGVPVARLVPEPPPPQTALEVFADLYRILDQDVAAALEAKIKVAREGRRELTADSPVRR